jgi:uncharacterized protein YndB with AHSA1/START domain
MAVFRLTRHIEAPPDAVYALWTDIARMHEWIEGISSVSAPSGPINQPGTTYTVRIGGSNSPTEVLAADPPRLFHTRFGNRMLRGENVARFEPEGAGTRLTQEMRTEGFVSAIFGRIFASGSYRGSFRGELNHFARIVERESGQR